MVEACWVGGGRMGGLSWQHDPMPVVARVVEDDPPCRLLQPVATERKKSCAVFEVWAPGKHGSKKARKADSKAKQGTGPGKEQKEKGEQRAKRERNN